MIISLLSAKDLTLGEGALYSVIGFVIVLLVLALLVGIFYLSGYVFQSKLFNKKEEKKPVTETSTEKTIEKPIERVNDDADELVAIITAAVACVLEEEYGGDAPEFVIKRIKRKK